MLNYCRSNFYSDIGLYLHLFKISIVWRPQSIKIFKMPEGVRLIDLLKCQLISSLRELICINDGSY